jgi:CRP/FNR family transcriptional regulator
LDKREQAQFESLIKHRPSIGKSDYLYQQGEESLSIYAVLSGSFKTIHTSLDGNERVMELYLPGNMIGLASLGDDYYLNSAIALETSSVCSFPLKQLHELCRQMPSLHKHVLHLLGAQISRLQDKHALYSYSAQGRVASFLMGISTHHFQQKLSATQFCLSMTRAEIGSYLGMSLETTSRVFSRLQHQKMIAFDNRDVQILDMQALEALAQMPNRRDATPVPRDHDEMLIFGGGLIAAALVSTPQHAAM